MSWNSTDTGRILGPVLIHFLVAYIIGMVGLHADAAFLTSVTAVLLLPLFLWMFRRDMRLFGEKEAKVSPLVCMEWIALGIFANLVWTGIVNYLVWKLGLSVSNEVQEALFASSFWMQFIGLGIFVPFMEEVLFRGLVYKRLKRYTNTVWPAVFLSSALFAVYHGNLLQILFAFPMGILLAAVYQKWNTLAAPVMFHMAVNISSVILTAIM